MSDKQGKEWLPGIIRNDVNETLQEMEEKLKLQVKPDYPEKETHFASNLDEYIEKVSQNIKLLALDVDGVLTDGTIYIGNDGEMFKGFSAKDGLGISCALRAGLKIAVITGRHSEIIHLRAKELGIELVMAGVKDKGQELVKLTQQLGISLKEVAYIGDDLNDLPAMLISGLSFAPSDASTDVNGAADKVLQHAGGKGAVREAIEFIMKAQDKWKSTIRSYYKCGQGDKQ